MTATMTADHYLATPDERPRWTELLNGEVFEMTSPSVRHQRIVAYLMFEFTVWLRSGGEGLSPASIDCRLDDGTVLAPDVLWIGPTSTERIRPSHLVGPPDLAVEVRSPSTWTRDTGPKWKAYEQAGLPELWLVDTEAASVMVYRRTPGSAIFDIDDEVTTPTVLTSPLMPGLSINLAELFAE